MVGGILVAQTAVLLWDGGSLVTKEMWPAILGVNAICSK